MLDKTGHLKAMQAGVAHRPQEPKVKTNSKNFLPQRARTMAQPKTSLPLIRADKRNAAKPQPNPNIHHGGTEAVKKPERIEFAIDSKRRGSTLAA